MEQIRVGLIGAGANTKSRHIPGFNKLKDIQLLSVANQSTQSSERVSKEFNIAETAENWRAILEDDRIDAVCIGTWPNMHCPITIAALNHGKHVLCEARMALNSQEAHEMLDASRYHPDLIAQIVPAPHTLEFDTTIKKLLADDFIGDLITLDGRVSFGADYPNFSSDLHWRHNRNFSGNNNELWYPGGEKAFLHNYLYQSLLYKNSSLWFTSLVSKKETIESLQKSGVKLNVKTMKIISMHQGNKVTRIIAWQS